LAGSVAGAAALLWTVLGLAQATPPAGPAPGFGPPNEFNPPTIEAPKLEKLSEDRYRIGTIVLDRKRRTFTAPGRVLHLDDAPLEYLAVARGGYKGYESVLELDSTASEFNLACILVGLDGEDVTKPKFQFDRQAVDGPRVLLELRWKPAGEPAVRIAAHEALVEMGNDGAQRPVSDDWVYIGSYLEPNSSRFGADTMGTVIGFVHDPASIVEHRAGLGIGAYGSVQVRKDRLPPIGTPIELVLSLPEARTPATKR
jgi:hypothetical protein